MIKLQKVTMGSSSWVDQDLDEFGVDFELTPCDVGSNRKLQIFVTLAQTSATGLKTGNFKCFFSSDKRAWTENWKLQMLLTLAQTSAPGLKTGNFKCFLHYM